MSISLDTDKLCTVLAGAALVIIGVHLKNGREQAGDDVPMFGLGTAAFVTGWAIVAYGLGLSPVAIAGSAAIVGAVMAMKGGKKMPDSILGTIAPFAGPLFIGGWLAVAYAAAGESYDLSSNRVMLAAAAFAGVMLSMLKILPEERKAKITDTLGMPIFTAAWFLLAAANSLT